MRPLMKDTPGTLDGSGWGCLGTALYTFPGLQQRSDLEATVNRSTVTVQILACTVAAAALTSHEVFPFARCNIKE